MPLPEKKSGDGQCGRARHAAMMKIGFRDGARSFLTGSRSVFCAGIAMRFGLSELPSSAVKRFTISILAPCFYFALANMIRCGRPVFELLEVFRARLRARCGRIAASITRCAVLIPAPANIGAAVYIHYPLTGPLCTPMRKRRFECCSLIARLISSAHSPDLRV